MVGSGDITGSKVGNEGILIKDAGGDEKHGKERVSGGAHFACLVRSAGAESADCMFAQARKTL